MKKRKFWLAALVCAVCALFGVMFAACGETEGGDPAGKTYTVTFDMQGHGTKPADIRKVEYGATITAPAAPEEDGYIFGGWYKEAGCENEWIFETDTVKGNMKLFAKWSEITFTLTFEVGEIGTAPAPITGIKKNATVTAPAVPEAEGYAFEGWYKEESCTTAWNFATDTITADTTVYAKWALSYSVGVYGEHTTVPVPENGYVYFTVPAAGTYYMSTGANSEESTYFLDENEVPKQPNYPVYLSVGQHKILSEGIAFEVDVTLSDLDLPFTQLATFVGSMHELVVSSLGVYNGEKTGAVSARIGYLDMAYDAVKAISFDDGYYKLEFSSQEGKYYWYIKLVTEGDVVTAVELKTEEGGEAETLSKALSATDVLVDLTANATGVSVSETIQPTFNYVYFNVESLLGQWVEFSNVAPDTEFLWCDPTDGRTGYVVSSINVVNGEPVYLTSEYYSCIAVSTYDTKTVSFTIKTVAAPKGMSESDPFVMTDNEYQIPNAIANGKYYISYTPSQAGKYVVSVSYLGMNWDGSITDIYTLYYKVNNVEYGYDELSWSWLGGLSSDDPVAEVALAASANSIVVTASSDAEGATITVKIEPLVVPPLASGTYTGMAPLSGDFYTAVVDAENLTISLSKEDWDWNVTELAAQATLTENDGVYSFAITDGTASFTITHSGNLKFTVSGETFTANKQAEEVPLVAGTYTYTEFGDSFVLTISGTEGAFKASFSSSLDGTVATDVDLIYEDGKYIMNFEFVSWMGSESITIHITALSENTLSVLNYNLGPDVNDGMTAEFTLGGGDVGEPADLVSGKYVGTDDNDVQYELLIDMDSMTVTYTVGGDSWSDLTLSESNGTYTFDYPWASDSDATVTFTVTEDGTGNLVLHVNDFGIEYEAYPSAR